MTTEGNITRRGKASWRLKYEGERNPVTGKRRVHWITVRGSKKDAQAELTRHLAERDRGTAVDPSNVTVGEYVTGWLDGAGHLAGTTLQRYRDLASIRLPRTSAGSSCRSCAQRISPSGTQRCSSAAAMPAACWGRERSVTRIGYCARC